MSLQFILMFALQSAVAVNLTSLVPQIGKFVSGFESSTALVFLVSASVLQVYPHKTIPTVTEITSGENSLN